MCCEESLNEVSRARRTTRRDTLWSFPLPFCLGIQHPQGLGTLELYAVKWPFGDLPSGLGDHQSCLSSFFQPPPERAHVAIPPLGADLASDVEQVEVEQADDAMMPATTATTEARAPTSTSTSHSMSSSRATTPSGSVLILVARVQKLETQMATLLQHMRPCM
uniref:Integrase core domain containing protein n=1 Tax=Solanum tuberosum TaxID=4113 RepID=M1E100_SOLTU